MLHIKKILFPTDFTSCAHQALEHALHLAKHHHAELHMLHAVVLHGMVPDNPNFRSFEVEEVEQHIETTADMRMRSALEERCVDGLTFKRVKKRGLSTAP